MALVVYAFGRGFGEWWRGSLCFNCGAGCGVQDIILSRVHNVYV